MCNSNVCGLRIKYNLKGVNKAQYCFNHKTKEMVDVYHPICKNGQCITRATKKYEGFCVGCFKTMFPEEQITKNYKPKECAVTIFLKSEFPNLNWIFDKQICGGNSKKRPDALLNLGFRILIVEIDENQHASYIGETSRMRYLFNDLNNMQIICIRFNPDNYKVNNTIVTSCWEYDEFRTLTISKNKITEWSSRLLLLKSAIIYWLEPTHTTKVDVEIIKLFYNT
jgi:hypothetical protein